MKIHEQKRLHNDTSSYRAEQVAIIMALDWIENLNIYVGIVILSDSLSTINAIESQIKENFVIEILIKITHLHYRGINITLEWIPSHCGLVGNEVVDSFAKRALKKNIEINNDLNVQELKSILSKRVREIGEERWKTIESPLKTI